MDTMLTVTHRMNAPLCEWPSQTFYLSRLEPSKIAASRRLNLSSLSEEGIGAWARALAPEPARVWLAVSHAGARTSSPEEVEVVAQVLLALRDSGMRWEEVGVVVPFRRQARLLRQRLGRELAQPLSSTGLVADTVERMQGQEREVVIISLVSSPPQFISRMAAFLFQPQRLNVAVTRARSKVILVASPELVQSARELPEAISQPWLSLFDHTQRIDF